MDCLKRRLRVLGYAGPEAVLEFAGNVLEVTHAAGADGLSALGLLAPVDCIGGFGVSKSRHLSKKGTSARVFAGDRVWPEEGSRREDSKRTLPGLSSRVTAGGAGVLLDVEGATS